jgi:transposase-like protein
MDEAEVDVLAYMTFRADHWSKIHSTNGLERLSGEIKRRRRRHLPKRRRYHPSRRRHPHRAKR